VVDVPPVSTRIDLAQELFAVVGRFRRQVRRLSPPAFGARLPESQAELIRLVGRRPDVSIRQAAAELGLAANTASTLVSKLCADDLLVRSVDPEDRRVGRLRLTEPAQRLADDSRAARRATLSAVLDRLTPSQVDQLTAGLEVLSEMTRMLNEEKT
jgi:DNA-binding MarR family transcriptional regulator